jgi:predicted flavoprotein YhiN
VGFVSSLYEEVPEMLEGDGSHNFTKKEFTQKYKMCHLSLNPKQTKVLKDYTKEEIIKLFGPITIKNGHYYIGYVDPKLVEKIKNLTC